MKRIDDLSYSNLVNLINNEEIKAGDVIDNIANEIEDVRTEIIRTEKVLSNLKLREKQILEASKLVVRHLEKNMPLAVIRQDYIIVVSDSDLSIERNVI